MADSHGHPHYPAQANNKMASFFMGVVIILSFMLAVHQVVLSASGGTTSGDDQLNRQAVSVCNGAAYMHAQYDVYVYDMPGCIHAGEPLNPCISSSRQPR